MISLQVGVWKMWSRPPRSRLALSYGYPVKQQEPFTFKSIEAKFISFTQPWMDHGATFI